MKPTTIVGIDPGAGGGIAIYKNNRMFSVVKMPKSIPEINEYFKEIKLQDQNAVIFLEKVQIFTSDTDQGGKQFGIKKMLANYEQLKTCILINDLQLLEIAPISWQSTCKFKTKGKTKTERKRIYQTYAEAVFPEIGKIALWGSDALCIVMSALIKYNNDPKWIADRMQNKQVDNLFNRKND